MTPFKRGMDRAPSGEATVEYGFLYLGEGGEEKKEKKMHLLPCNDIREAAIEAQKAGDVPLALERLQYAEKRCPESRMKALRKIKRLISALNFYIFADSADSSGPGTESGQEQKKKVAIMVSTMLVSVLVVSSDARRQTDEAFQGAISAIDEWKDYISAFWFLQAALRTCPASAQAARNKIMAKLDVCNQKMSEEA